METTEQIKRLDDAIAHAKAIEDEGKLAGKVPDFWHSLRTFMMCLSGLEDPPAPPAAEEPAVDTEQEPAAPEPVVEPAEPVEPGAEGA